PTATTDVYPLSLHDALPISDAPPHREATVPRTLLRRDGRARIARRADRGVRAGLAAGRRTVARPAVLRVLGACRGDATGAGHRGDRKSTRLNSSHVEISYAV